MQLITATSTPDLRNLYKLKQSIKRLGCPVPIVVGGNDNLGLLKRFEQIGCCNTEIGFNSGQVVEFYYNDDEYPETNSATFDVNSYVAFVPGLWQVVRWYEFGSAGRLPNGDTEGIIIDPETGMRFDMATTWNSCDRTYTLTFRCWYDFINFTDDPNFFAPADPLAGTRGGFLFTTT